MKGPLPPLSIPEALSCDLLRAQLVELHQNTTPFVPAANEEIGTPPAFLTESLSSLPLPSAEAARFAADFLYLKGRADLSYDLYRFCCARHEGDFSRLRPFLAAMIGSAKTMGPTFARAATEEAPPVGALQGVPAKLLAFVAQKGHEMKDAALWAHAVTALSDVALKQAFQLVADVIFDKAANKPDPDPMPFRSAVHAVAQAMIPRVGLRDPSFFIEPCRYDCN